MTGPAAAPAAARAATEVRPVGVEAFDDVYPLLQRFPTTRMTAADWRFLLFTYPWSQSAQRGFALYADGKAVGFIGTIFSERPLLGRVEKFCNASSWIVLEEYRYAALLLVRAVMRLSGYTHLNLTPSPAAHTIFSRLGMKPLETEQLVLAPVPGPVQTARALRGAITLAPAALEGGLAGEELAHYRALSSSPVAHHVLLQRDGRRCYLVATRSRKRGVPFAEIQHLSDPAFFWEHRMLAHAALARAMGVAGLAVAVDARFLVGKAPPFTLRWKAKRLYLPTKDDITPVMIDGLYTEQMGLRY